MSDYSLNDTQFKALKAIKEWYSSSNQVFTLAGPAGSGKSFLISKLVEELGLYDSVIYATLTGKAAVVLRNKGVNAVTIHRLIYRPVKDPITKKVRFVKRERLEKNYSIIIVDEYSMVSDEIEEDLMSFGKKILVVGDPHQLPPVFGKQTRLVKPDCYLSEIVRQAKDSPIIYLSQMIIQGRTLSRGTIGKDILIAPMDSIKDSVYLNADQILCGTNVNRQTINQRVRDMLGFEGIFPNANEKVISTKNNWEVEVEGVPIINGTMSTVTREVEDIDDKTLLVTVRPDHSEVQQCALLVAKGCFNGEKFSKLDNCIDTMDYGYAITVHKAQGSEYDKVLLIDDWKVRDSRKNWLYTGITRAKSKLIIGI